MDIFYFTGTGNSYSVANELSKYIKDSRLVSIVKRVNENNFISEANKIGFVFPLYYFGLPFIVERFLKKLVIDKTDYIFYIVTSGDPPGKKMCVTSVINRMLKSKNKFLSAGYRLMMPSNYLIVYDLEKEETVKAKIKCFKVRIKTIAGAINENKERELKDKSKMFSAIVHWLWKINVKKSDKKFYVTDKCNGCGVCVRVCPVNNVKLNGGKPEWLHNCEECVACINLCPEHAIQSGKVSLRNSRYHNPDIKISNIINQK